MRERGEPPVAEQICKSLRRLLQLETGSGSHRHRVERKNQQVRKQIENLYSKVITVIRIILLEVHNTPFWNQLPAVQLYD